GCSPRQFAACADHGAGEAFAGADLEARARDRRADHLSPECGRHGGDEARSGGVSAALRQTFAVVLAKARTHNPERLLSRDAVAAFVPALTSWGNGSWLAPGRRYGFSYGARCLLHSQLSRFPAEHRLLAGDAPVITGQLAVLAERAMTGHHERHRVLADRGADGARGFRALDAAGDVRIGDRAAHRDLEQRLPYAHLEVGADQHHAQRLVRPPQLAVEDALRERRGTFDVLD